MTAVVQFPPQISKLIPRLASNHVVVTARPIEQALKKAGLDYHSIAAVLEGKRNDDRVPHDWRDLVRRCRDPEGRLSEREADFIAGMSGWCGEPTPRQQDWLRRIYAKLHGARTP